MKKDIDVRQAAYAKYQLTRRRTNLPFWIAPDVDAVGKAQTALGIALVPFHLKAYAAFTPAQQITFQILTSSQ